MPNGEKNHLRPFDLSYVEGYHFYFVKRSSNKYILFGSKAVINQSDIMEVLNDIACITFTARLMVYFTFLQRI